MTGPVRTLVVWCPDWAVLAAGARLDEPVMVVRANRVVACSPAARALDVTVGLRRREAQGRCPHIRVIEHDPVTEARRFEPVLAAVEAFSPRLEVTHPGACALATRGPSRYFGGDERLAARVAEAVDGVLGALDPSARCQVGIADGPFPARLAARRAVGSPLVVPPGASPAFLAPLPLSALDRPDLAEVLARLGLRTLGDLAALPRGSVVGRFGVEGDAAHRLASGLDEHPPHLTTPPADFGLSTEIDPPSERVEPVAFVAKGLAGDLCDRLGALGLACTRVVVLAETDHGESHERVWGHDGALTPAAIADRVRWQLEGWLQGPVRVRPTAGITRLVLAPDEVRAATGRQLGFWGGETEAAERAARALARVEGLLGAEAVSVVEWRGGRSPVEQVRRIPVGAVDLVDRTAGLHGAPTGTAVPPWPGRLPAPSPAGVHHPSRRAEVLDGTGRVVVVDGRGAVSSPPAGMAVDGGPPTPIIAWAGPWPVDERWWDPGRRRRRARFQVVTEDGTAHLLAIEGGRWWCDATYD